MPNNGRVTACPFYKDEKNKSISCEDIYRTFRYPKQKWDWMDKYCDMAWEQCPYAKDLLLVYDKIEEGDDEAVMKHIIEALRKELKKVKTMLGRAERRLSAKDEEIRKLRREKRTLEDMYSRLQIEMNEERERANYFYQKLFITMPTYEARFCYLMEKHSGGIFDEREYQEWSKGKEFRLEASEKDEDGNVLLWRSVVRESKDEPNNVYADKKK